MNEGTDGRAGGLDPDFGDGGIAAVAHSITRWPVRIATAYGLGDGRIACAGTLNAFRSVVFKLQEDGSLDRKFGNRGFCELPMNPEVRFGRGFFPEALHVDADGAMLVLGRIDVLIDRSAAKVPAVVRVSADGRLDPWFGEGGLAIYVPPPFVSAGISPELSGFAAAPRGKVAARQATDGGVVFIASADLPSGERQLLVKIRPDGVLDPSFGQGGFATPRMALTHGLDIDRMGRIVVSGGVNQSGYLMRYLADGQEDATFGTAGFAWLPPPPGTSSLTAMDLHSLDDGRLYALALLQERAVLPALAKSTAGVYRLTVDGKIDKEFNEGQPAVVDLLPDGYSPDGLDIDDGGRLLVTGKHISVSYDPGGGQIISLTFAASRQFATGTLDPDFGEGGRVRITFLQMPEAVFVSGTQLVFVARTRREGRAVVGRLLG